MTPDPQAETASASLKSASHGDAILRLLDRPIPPAELLAGTQRVAQSSESKAIKSMRVLPFKLGAETAAIHARFLRRVTPVVRVRPIPHRSSGAFRGLCNILGELVLCVDLHHILGLPPRVEVRSDAESGSDTRRMVMMGPIDNSWAFEVDGVMGVESVDPEAFRVAPVTVEYALGDYTLGVTDLGSKTVTILDGERLLAGFKAGLA